MVRFVSGVGLLLSVMLVVACPVALGAGLDWRLAADGGAAAPATTALGAHAVGIPAWPELHRALEGLRCVIAYVRPSHGAADSELSDAFTAVAAAIRGDDCATAWPGSSNDTGPARMEGVHVFKARVKSRSCLAPPPPGWHLPVTSTPYVRVMRNMRMPRSFE